MSPSKPFVLFFNAIRHAQPIYSKLQEVAHTEVISSKSRAEFFDDLQTKYKNIFAIYRTSASGAIAGPFDAEFISRLPPSCKYICHNGAGYDPIDIPACTARGITVTNAPDPVTAATADTALFLLLGALRQFNPALASLRAGTFKNGVPFGHDPQGKTLGILGMGRIGRAVQHRCAALGMKTIYHNRTALPAAQAAGAKYVSFETLISQSDVVSVHVPLTSQTRHLIDAAVLGRMKPGVVVVNTARGAVVDEAALADALESGHVAAVGLDVYEREPAVEERLGGHERALLLPHVGTHTVETLGKMEAWAMKNVRRAVVGEEVLSPVV